MGKKLIQQRRGRAKGKFGAPSHRFKGDIKYIQDLKNKVGTITDIIHDPGRTAPLVHVTLEDNTNFFTLAHEGAKIGDKIKFLDENYETILGNVLSIGKIPEGMPIFNVELSPGDGGKLARAGGTAALVVSHSERQTVIRLPSGKFKSLDSNCRATIGIVAGGGRKDKPFVKAGKKYHAFKARGKQYPIVRGVAMNPVSHPHGGGSHQHIGKPSTVKRGAPPGRKVGSISAKRTGRRK